MRFLGFIPIKSRRLMPGGYRDTVTRGWARPFRELRDAHAHVIVNLTTVSRSTRGLTVTYWYQIGGAGCFTASGTVETEKLH